MQCQLFGHFTKSWSDNIEEEWRTNLHIEKKFSQEKRKVDWVSGFFFCRCIRRRIATKICALRRDSAKSNINEMSSSSEIFNSQQKLHTSFNFQIIFHNDWSYVLNAFGWNAPIVQIITKTLLTLKEDIYFFGKKKFSCSVRLIIE